MSNTPSKIKFSVISDFHYRKHTCASTVDDLNTIFDRAKEKDTDFLIHCGDFCNDYSGSPEIVKEYLKNEYDLSVYGVYGNHELESKGNTMELVTPMVIPRSVLGIRNFRNNGIRKTSNSFLMLMVL